MNPGQTKRRKRAARKARTRPSDLPPIDIGKIVSDFFTAISGGMNQSIVKVDIPPEMYRKLLMLCHPDKHGNSETATEVTRWLLEERGKV